MTADRPADDVCRWMIAEHETEIAARPELVWHALTEDIGQWWNPGFYALANAKGMRLEPVIGGRMYEHAEDGSAVVWFTVIGIQPGRSIDLAGHLSVAFGGPSVALLRFDVTDGGDAGKPDSTIVKATESRVGLVSPDAATSAKKGWEMLFDKGLKPHVEHLAQRT